VQLAVNLSGRHFGNPEILDLVRELLVSCKADPHSIIFEVTETAAVENVMAAKQFIEALCRLGCRFALDDFGVGFSSLHYLKNLPVDFIKIDGSFVRDLPTDKGDRVFVKAITDLAEGLGITTIAEFVENEAIVAALRDLGVHLGQGFYLGRPAPSCADGSICRQAGDA
jgi:EAL domain-containing protein (putative c-di-GMP-specific phosphodiesterase class I)